MTIYEKIQTDKKFLAEMLINFSGDIPTPEAMWYAMRFLDRQIVEKKTDPRPEPPPVVRPKTCQECAINDKCLWGLGDICNCQVKKEVKEE